MIHSVHSKITPSFLLHQFYTPDPQTEIAKFSRIDISPPDQSLQVAFLHLPERQTFKAHKHILHKRDMPIAQESWVVMQGSVKVFYYDIDDKLIDSVILAQGSISLTYHGGHNYLSLAPSTLVYEFKTGPYLGQQYDKVFLD